MLEMRRPPGPGLPTRSSLVETGCKGHKARSKIEGLATCMAVQRDAGPIRETNVYDLLAVLFAVLNDDSWPGIVESAGW